MKKMLMVAMLLSTSFVVEANTYLDDYEVVGSTKQDRENGMLKSRAQLMYKNGFIDSGINSMIKNNEFTRVQIYTIHNKLDTLELMISKNTKQSDKVKYRTPLRDYLNSIL